MGAPRQHDSPHDTLFRTVFERPEEAAGLVRLVLPPRLVRHLGIGGLRLAPSVFVDQVLGTRQADILYELPLARAPERSLYVLVEHQSTSDGRMLRRMLDYGLRGADSVLRQTAAAALPAVVPVVVSHAPGGFAGPTRLTDLTDLPAEVRAALGGLALDQRIVVLDLERKSDGAIVRSRATAFGRLALLLLKNARAPGLAARIERWSSLLRRVWRERGPDAIETAARYALAVGEESKERLGAAMQRAIGPRAREVVMTAAEKLREEGRAEGREEGSRQARVETLLRLLRLRFGDVPAEAQARLEAAAPPDLDRWLDRVLTAESLDDVFAP